MIVDDLPENLQVLSEMLSGQGYRIRAVPTGPLALKAARSYPPNLILLDIRMPDMDGFTVCRKLKDETQTAGIPVIFISALGELEDKIRAFESGGVDYITKPFEATEVLARVRTQLSVVQNTQELEKRVQERTKKLAISEKRLREAQQIAGLGNWELDLTTNALYWSDEVYRIFGIKPQQFGASYESFLDVIHPDDRERVKQAYQKAMAEHTPYAITHRIIRQDDGRVRHVHERSEEIVDSSGVVIRSVGTVQDITDLEQINRRLRLHLEINKLLSHAKNEQELLHKFCHTVVKQGGFRVAWIFLDRPDSDTDVWLSAQKGSLSCNYTKQVHPLAGDKNESHPVKTLVQPDTGIILKEGRGNRNSIPCCLKPQDCGVGALFSVPITYDEKEMGTLIVCDGDPDLFDSQEQRLLKTMGDDLAFGIHTQRLRKSLHEHRVNLEGLVEMRTRELKDANKKLMELDRLKSMFIATMSHELRTPLNSIIGFTKMTLEGLSGELNDEQKDNLSRAYQSGKHLLELITDVIDISKIEAGRIDIYPSDFSLTGLIDEAAGIFERDLAKKGLTLTTENHDDIRMFTDRKRVLQCLINYLGNAVKFTEKGEIRIIVKKTRGMVNIQVTDTGIGIADNDMEKLFKPFERLDSHMKYRTGGTGLGLYLTKKIVTELLLGSVSCKSRVNRGSKFEMEIPIKMATVADDDTRFSKEEDLS